MARGTSELPDLVSSVGSASKGVITPAAFVADSMHTDNELTATTGATRFGLDATSWVLSVIGVDASKSETEAGS